MNPLSTRHPLRAHIWRPEGDWWTPLNASNTLAREEGEMRAVWVADEPHRLTPDQNADLVKAMLRYDHLHWFVMTREPEFAEVMVPRLAQVHLLVGPIHTRAEADKLVLEAYLHRERVDGVVLAPTARLDLFGTMPCPMCGRRASDIEPGCGICRGRRAPIKWVVAMGSSTDRPATHPDWLRLARDQCRDAGVPFWFDGWDDWAPDPMQYGLVSLHDPDEFRHSGAWFMNPGGDVHKLIVAAAPDAVPFFPADDRIRFLLDNALHRDMPPRLLGSASVPEPETTDEPV